MTNSNNTNHKLDPEHPLAGLESLMDIDPTTGVPLVTAFAPRTQSEVESRQWLYLRMREMRRREWNQIGRQINLDGTDFRPRYRFDGKDEEPKDV